MKINNGGLANIAIILICSIAVLSQVVQRLASIPHVEVLPATGQRVKNVSALGLARASRTFILITASTCHFCTDSMPFYRRLTPLATSHGGRVVGVSWEPIETNSAYFASHGVTVDGTIAASQTGIDIHSTPTLILVDKKGVVIKAWAGKLV